MQTDDRKKSAKERRNRSSILQFRSTNFCPNDLVNRIKDFNAPSTVFWQANSVDANGAVLDESLGNGLQTVRGFDPLTGLTDYVQSGTGGTTNVQDLQYQWDLAGNLTDRGDLNRSVTEHFEYDGLHRLDYSTLNGTTNLDLDVDLLGNIQSRVDSASATYGTGHTISWYANNLPKQISAPSASSTFYYTPSGARWRQNATNGSASETSVYIGGVLERFTSGSVTEHRHYIPTGSDTGVLYTRRSSGSNSTYYITKDHLGSASAITDNSGSVLVQESFGALGERRGANWQGVPSAADLSQIAATTPRGFTDHEHLDGLSLIHMNGRIYDPRIGRFISGDRFVQAPHNGQSFNRYAYVFNNPLTFTDPSGFTTNPPTSPDSPDSPDSAPGYEIPDLGYPFINKAHHDARARRLPHLPSPGRVDWAQSGEFSIVGEFGQGLINAAVPGAYYGGQSELAWREGRYVTSGFLFVGALGEAALGVFTLGESTALLSSTRIAAANLTRALRLPNYSISLGRGVLGSTDAAGNVTIAAGLTRAEQVATLRHESVHAFLSVRGTGSIARARQQLGMWGYNKSQLLRFGEEALAEGYATRSLLQGLAHPLVHGYGITPSGLLLEATLVGGGIYGTYELVDGD